MELFRSISCRNQANVVAKPRRNQAMNEMKLQREPFKPTPKNRSLKLW
ncbi:MAG TPA: hypothetical protein VMW91_09315 [Desulfosporosinus sp.]|nr:hypothetical protein [Desulfosporosinus sp.]